MMHVQLQFDNPTAARVAEFLELNGMPKAAADVWLGLCADDPYDRTARERFGEIYFRQKQAQYPAGTLERSRFILHTIGVSFPTPLLREAYFDNLGQMLQARPRRQQPGMVVIGLGTGRSGSTTLTAAFEALPDVCATHENPPLVSWEPVQEQIQFHLDRFRLLADYFAVVFDASHSWLTSLPRVFAELADSKAIGLYRDTQACVRSYMTIKGSGPGSINHWVAPRNGLWRTGPGDPSYPTYDAPANSIADPDAAKARLIERYVTDYNRRLHELAAQFPQRLLLARTEDLNNPQTSARFQEFLGLPLVVPGALNVGGTADSHRLNQKY